VIHLPEGLAARPTTFEDVEAVTRLIAACELTVHGEIDTDRSEVEVSWRQPSFDLAADSLLVFEADRLVAEAEIFHGLRAEVSVHPEVHELIETAFDRPHHDRSTFEDWAATTIGREDFEPWKMQVAVDGEEIVGAAAAGVHPDGGWVDQLAVRSSHRGRGLGRALLQRSFVSFFDRGAWRARLSTKSSTGALGLYERVGMHVTRWYTHYAKEV